MTEQTPNPEVEGQGDGFMHDPALGQPEQDRRPLDEDEAERLAQDEENLADEDEDDEETEADDGPIPL